MRFRTGSTASSSTHLPPGLPMWVQTIVVALRLRSSSSVGNVARMRESSAMSVVPGVNVTFSSARNSTRLPPTSAVVMSGNRVKS